MIPVIRVGSFSWKRKKRRKKNVKQLCSTAGVHRDYFYVHFGLISLNMGTMWTWTTNPANKAGMTH